MSDLSSWSYSSQSTPAAEPEIEENGTARQSGDAETTIPSRHKDDDAACCTVDIDADDCARKTAKALAALAA